MNWILTPSGRSSRAPPPASLFSDSDWPSTLNRPTFASGTNTLTWVGPSGGGANNGNPVQQSRVLTNTAGFTTSGSGIIQGLNVTDFINVAHSNVTIKQCRIITNDPSTGFSINITANVTGLLVEDCLLDGSNNSVEGICPNSGVLQPTTLNIIRRNLLKGYENHITFNNVGVGNIAITDNLLTACANAGNPSFDGDMIELYQCDNILIQHNMFDGTGSQTSPGIVNSFLNLSNLGPVTNITFNNNMFANCGVLPVGGSVVDEDAHFGASAMSWSCTNIGFFNLSGKSYIASLHNSVQAPAPSPNSGNYDAATQTATSGTLINGTGAI